VVEKDRECQGLQGAQRAEKAGNSENRKSSAGFAENLKDPKLQGSAVKDA
jgi:hypothetical protein